MTDMLASNLAADLASLRDHNRRELTSLTESLRSGVYRDDRLGANARRDELAKLRRSELATMPLALAHIFAHRVGRAAAGAAACLGVLAVLAVVATPSLLYMLSWQIMWLPFSTMAVTFGAAVLGVYVVATWIAEAYFARRMAAAVAANGDVHNDLDRLADSPTEVGHRLVRRVDGAAAGLAIAGLVSIVAMAACVLFFDGASRAHPDFWPQRALAVAGGLENNIELISVLLMLFGVPAFFVARACNSERRGVKSLWLSLRHGLVPVIGFAIAFVTLRGGIAMSRIHRIPMFEERAGTVLAGLLAIFLVATWLVLRWRQREQRTLEGSP